MFFEANGIKLGLTSWKPSPWISLEGKEYKAVNGHTYKIKFRSTPVMGSLLLTADKSHIIYVRKVNKTNKIMYCYEISISPMPSSWESYQIPYGDSWYVDTTHGYSEYPYATYITSVFVK